MRRIGLLVVAATLSVPSILPARPAAGAEPAVVLRATCAVRSPTHELVWFGFTNRAARHLAIPLGAANSLRFASTGEAAPSTQTTDFVVGRRDRAFLAKVETGRRLRWRVTVPSYDPATHAISFDPMVTVTATSGPDVPDCAATVPRRGVTAQYAPGGWRLSVRPAREVRSAGTLTTSYVRLALSGIRTACVNGGTPLTPTVLWGYAPTTAAQDVMLLAGAGANYAPLDPGQIVRVDSMQLPGEAAGSFVRSYATDRRVVDPQQITLFGSTPIEQERNPQPRGYSGAVVLADVRARCRFGTTIVSSATPLLVDADGRGISVHTVTDQPSQSSRPIVVCPNPLPPFPVLGCDVPMLGVFPGGTRFR